MTQVSEEVRQHVSDSTLTDEKEIPEEYNASEYYDTGRRWMRADDLTGSKPLSLIIDDVDRSENLRNPERTDLVLIFHEMPYKLRLNKTNALALVAQYGRDYRRWVGRSVTLAVVPVTFQGRSVPGIRILG
jgi:hypothetical protein